MSNESKPDPGADESAVELGGGSELLDRLVSFRFTYLAILAFILLWVFSVQGLESVLTRYFYQRADEAMTITDFDAPVATKIRARIDEFVQQSLWVTLGGVEVSPMVIARDGTFIYIGGYHNIEEPERIDLTEIGADLERLLPATAIINVRVPYNALAANGIAIAYFGLLIQILWLRNRSQSRLEIELLGAAVEDRRSAESRARKIESELEQMRHEFHAIEPTDPEVIDEVTQLRDERQALRSKLAEVESREQELHGRAAKSGELGKEIRALEDLLEEASDDLQSKDSAIQDLEKTLKRVSKDAAAEQSARSREADVLSRRFGTLYSNLEIDSRALDDIVGLRDELMKLKCEDKLKRLSDEADNVAVRRKVGGLPPHLTIFEIGFAGKGRIYYMKGKQRRFRVLNVGAKNTQNAAMEYLRKL